MPNRSESTRDTASGDSRRVSVTRPSARAVKTFPVRARLPLGVRRLTTRRWVKVESGLEPL